MDNKRNFHIFNEEAGQGSEIPKKRVFRQQNTFQLQLPDIFDFEELVLGENGADWDFIQRNYIPSDVTFTWGYKDEVPEMAMSSQDATNNSHMGIGYTLIVGRTGMSTAAEDDTNILIVWKIVLKWHNLCSRMDSTPKPLKLLFHEYAMDARRQASEVPKPLPTCYQIAQTRAVRERKLCTVQVQEILDRGGDKMGDSLEEWLIKSFGDVGLKSSEKIDLVSFQWYFHANDNDELQRLRAEQWRLAMLQRYPDPSPEDFNLWW